MNLKAETVTRRSNNVTTADVLNKSKFSILLMIVGI